MLSVAGFLALLGPFPGSGGFIPEVRKPTFPPAQPFLFQQPGNNCHTHSCTPNGLGSRRCTYGPCTQGGYLPGVYREAYIHRDTPPTMVQGALYASLCPFLPKNEEETRLVMPSSHPKKEDRTRLMPPSLTLGIPTMVYTVPPWVYLSGLSPPRVYLRTVTTPGIPPCMHTTGIPPCMHTTGIYLSACHTPGYIPLSLSHTRVYLPVMPIPGIPPCYAHPGLISSELSYTRVNPLRTVIYPGYTAWYTSLGGFIPPGMPPWMGLYLRFIPQGVLGWVYTSGLYLRVLKGGLWAQEGRGERE